jgi:HSP20 family molecular chaperone IbpA
MASSLRCETCAGDRANASTAPSGTCGRFYRRIGIPERVKAEDAVAAFKSGVLEIEMPAIPVPEVKKRTVEIKG